MARRICLTLDEHVPMGMDERLGSKEPLVEIERANQRLCHVAQNVVAFRAAVITRLLTKPQMGADTECARNLGTGVAGNNTVEPPRQLPLGFIRKGSVEPVRHRQTQHAVAEKFQPLITRATTTAVSKRSFEE